MRVLARVGCVGMAAASLIAGCGSDDSSKEPGATVAASSSSSDSDASSSSEGTTTTTEVKIPTSPETISATLTAVDMGKGWRVYPDEAKSVAGTGGGSCEGDDAIAADKTVTAANSGEILQRGKLDRYVSTTTWGFASAADAKAYATSRLTDRWIECVRSSTEAGLSKDPKQTVKSYGIDRTVDGDFFGWYGLEFDQEIDGEQKYTGAYSLHQLWLKGSIVIDTFVQNSPREDDPKDIDKLTGAEVDAGMAKVVGRITA